MDQPNNITIAIEILLPAGGLEKYIFVDFELEEGTATAGTPGL